MGERASIRRDMLKKEHKIGNKAKYSEKFGHRSVTAVIVDRLNTNKL